MRSIIPLKFEEEVLSTSGGRLLAISSGIWRNKTAYSLLTSVHIVITRSGIFPQFPWLIPDFVVSIPTYIQVCMQVEHDVLVSTCLMCWAGGTVPPSTYLCNSTYFYGVDERGSTHTQSSSSRRGRSRQTICLQQSSSEQQSTRRNSKGKYLPSITCVSTYLPR